MSMFKDTKKKFLNLPKDFSDLEKSKVVIIPFPFERSTSYGHGTKNGPMAIIDASQKLELFDEELEKEIYREFGISTLKEIKPKNKAERALKQLFKIIKEVYQKNKFPIVLGGEHTLAFGSFRAALEKYKKLTLVQFDAHADLRDSIEKNKYSHGAVMRRCLELSNNINLVQIGIRSISNNPEDGYEFDFWRTNQNRIKTFWAKDSKNWSLDEIANNCAENVYLSFDVDAFDTGIMPSTGTPEPGGLGWYLVLNIFKKLAEKRKIVGADFVELLPIKDFIASDFLVAKLIYHFLGILAKNNQL